jgi:four helix bundle protein
MAAMNAKEFSDRLWDFSVQVARVVESMPDTRVGRHVAGQLIRCGTSPAPNYDEGCDAESRNDFTHKLAIAAKEMRETSGWLRFVVRFGLLPEKQVGPVLDEAMQLRRMLGSSLKTVSLRPDLPPRSPPPNEQ